MEKDFILTKQRWKICDCKDGMREMNECSVDLIVTDPPYGYSFMGKDWDKAVPSVDIWQECLRILKPGAFAFIMSAPRQDVLAHNLVNLSDVGFETGFTSIYWTYSAGFPKAGNISKLIDKRLGAEREVVGVKQYADGKARPNIQSTSGSHDGWKRPSHEENYSKEDRIVTEPSTSQAKLLDGSYGGFQPKPAVEVIMVVMKPLSEKTYVDQALANQKGITWLDDGRIPYQSDGDMSSVPQSALNSPTGTTYGFKTGTGRNGEQWNAERKGRFPANLLVSDDVLNDGNNLSITTHYPKNKNNWFDGTHEYDRDDMFFVENGSFSRYFDLGAWWNSQIKHLPKEVQKTFPFLITPKASKSEKNGSTHPTVKPVKLFTYLTTIGSREGDTVCDPFLGSGTELEACLLTNRNCIGFDISDEWVSDYRIRTREGMRLDKYL